MNEIDKDKQAPLPPPSEKIGRRDAIIKILGTAAGAAAGTSAGVFLPGARVIEAKPIGPEEGLSPEEIEKLRKAEAHLRTEARKLSPTPTSLSEIQSHYETATDNLLEDRLSLAVLATYRGAPGNIRILHRATMSKEDYQFHKVSQPGDNFFQLAARSYLYRAITTNYYGFGLKDNYGVNQWAVVERPKYPNGKGPKVYDLVVVLDPSLGDLAHVARFEDMTQLGLLPIADDKNTWAGNVPWLCDEGIKLVDPKPNAEMEKTRSRLEAVLRSKSLTGGPFNLVLRYVPSGKSFRIQHSEPAEVPDWRELPAMYLFVQEQKPFPTTKEGAEDYFLEAVYRAKKAASEMGDPIITVDLLDYAIVSVNTLYPSFVEGPSAIKKFGQEKEVWDKEVEAFVEKWVQQKGEKVPQPSNLGQQLGILQHNLWPIPQMNSPEPLVLSLAQ